MISAESMKKREVGGRWEGVCTCKLSSHSLPRAGPRGAGGKPTHSHPLSLCQLQTAEKSLRGLGRGVTTLPVFPKAQHSLPHKKSSTSTVPKSVLLIDSSVHGTMRAAAGCPAVPSRSQPANGVGGPSYSRGPGPGGGRTGLGAQRAGSPWAPQPPPPLLRLERFQGRGAATLASALAQRSSSFSSCCSSCSSYSSRCPQLPFLQPAPPFPPSPSSRSLPANFPEPRPAAQSSAAA